MLSHGNVLNILITTLALHIAIVGYVASTNSPTCDEVGHMAAGLYIWEYGRFDLYRVNPPLTRAIATIPVALMRPHTDWSKYEIGGTKRPEWSIGQDFIEVNPDQWFMYWVIARFALIPFSVLGAYICFRWSSELFGAYAGLSAAVLWCFSPNVIAWSSTITPDLTATSLGVTTAYSFWHWLKSRTWKACLIAGGLLGVALLSKMTWIILFALWPLIWIVWNNFERKNDHERTCFSGFSQLATLILIAIYVVNLGYAFDGSLKGLGDYDFVSKSLNGNETGVVGNRFHGTVLGHFPVPLPHDFVSGIDLQKVDFEEGKTSYLNGELKEGGWWYYYIEAALIKTPLGTLMLALLAIVLVVSKRKYDSSLQNLLPLFLPPLAVFLLVSSQTGFSRYYRYVLPCLPFVFIFLSSVFGISLLQHKFIKRIGAISLTASVISSLSLFPHFMSYFNYAIGGPRHGHNYLIDANIDWGQDLWRLKEWQDLHPEVDPLRVATLCFVSPKHYGIKYLYPSAGPEPGWYAMSIHMIHGYSTTYQYFLEFEPVELVGYSIYIYYLSVEDANHARKLIGLPLLGDKTDE